MLVRLHSLASVWRALLLVASGGVLGWFQAPYNYWWLGLLGFPVLLLVLQPLKGWAAFRAGWLFGFGYFLFGLYWIANALFVDIAQFWWALPLAIAGLPMVCAVFVGLAAVVTQAVAPRGLAQVLAFAASWALLEFARGHVFTGFPWLLWGYGFTHGQQLAALVGAYGVSLVAVLLVALPAAFYAPRWPSRVAAAVLMVAVLAGSMSWQNYWLAQEGQAGQTFRLRLVQPNIAQSLKLDRGAREQQIANLLDLTAMPAADRIDAVVWPETALPYQLADAPALRSRIAAQLPLGSVLLTGNVRIEEPATGETRYYNSLVGMGSTGEMLGSYDKAHLVPFGEYIPFRQWLPFDPIAGAGEFTAGPGPRTLQFGSLAPVSPSVCYEIIFPNAVATRSEPPQWLLNVTNDGWYGLTHGPYQHLRSATFRAIEEGRVLVRVANSGITAVITAHGQIQSSLPLGTRGVIDSLITLRQLNAPYVLYGNAPYLMLVTGLLLGGFLLFRWERRPLA